MAIAKMRRLKMLALSEDRDELLQCLLKAGCVEITEPEAELSDPEWAALTHRNHAALGQVKGKAAAVQAALEALKKYAPVKSGLFTMRQDVDAEHFFAAAEREAVLQKAAEINDYNRQISQILSQENRLNSSKLSLMPWASLEVDVSLTSTMFCRVLFGVCPAAADSAEIMQVLANAAPLTQPILVSSDRDQHYFMLIAHREDEERALAVLRPFAFSPFHFKDTSGTPAQNIESLTRELAGLSGQRQALAEKIAEEAPWRERLLICADQMTQEIAKEEAKSRLLTTGSLIFLKGWVPQAEEQRLIEAIAGLTCASELSEPAEDEIPPTLLKNSKLIHSMQMVTEMYSLPVYHGIDPNPLIFPFFTIFFGMMFADVAYGLILIILSQIIIRKYKPKGTFGNIMQLGTICGFTAACWGVVSGGFFGDAYSVIMEAFFDKPGAMLYTPLIDPMANPMNVLMLAIAMGAIQLLTGQIIHIYLGFRDKTPWEGILDVVPWWLVFAGIALLALKDNSYLLLLGVAALICTQGRHRKGLPGKILGGIASLYDITSWLGDILSYTRLMALMLAGTVIASVMNILGTLPGNIFVFFIIFAIGHVFNIGVNIIGTYVHAARLQYLEFFSKFYQEGGRPFAPLYCNTKYVDVIYHKKQGGEAVG